MVHQRLEHWQQLHRVNRTDHNRRGVNIYTGPGINTLRHHHRPDGALWFTNGGNASIGRITTGGVVTDYSDPEHQRFPSASPPAPTALLWFTNDGNNSIGRITTAGVVSNYTDPGISDPDEHHDRSRRRPVVHQLPATTPSGGSPPPGW